MGLIKSGIMFAGAYGLMKTGSKAMNDYQDKKSQNQQDMNQPHPMYSHPQMNYSDYGMPQYPRPWYAHGPEYQRSVHNLHRRSRGSECGSGAQNAGRPVSGQRYYASTSQ